MVSLNTYMNSLASSYYISHGSYERTAINGSVITIQKWLNEYFGKDILEVEVFGSWNRDTTLPRKYNSNSDVDIMIIFDHERLQNTPETYRTWLKGFAEKKYSRSQIQKDFPTVRVDMKHITFDLIPTKKTSFLITSYYIPDINNNWMSTEPHSFTNTVVSKNTTHGSIVKPVLRLIKCWNANNGQPFDSYLLEKHVIENVWWFFNNSIEDAFFAACKSLSSWGGTTFQNSKVQTLHNNVDWVREYQRRNDLSKAKQRLHKILPI
ncbi:SMODS domain-containing nucleotidyltransferase [Parvicella tangerina]|uniref:Nucleotidyltransferase n=1 Tax=Parvicella tangerina TaxID=2829795 RepID=A0A916JLE2_9FLAO|nr:nucleotidyltransferase domain-containing protein [Parvicella tangerina]CAG5077562.1 hypothetical protein CRYO30217_00426 [Parvicella tangerina]